MQKESVSSHSLATFLSPSIDATQKGWYSERVAPSKTQHKNNKKSSTSSSRRYTSSASLTPFYSGRTLPSKWEDAERWICSPVELGHAKIASSVSSCHHRPKSKSGPLGNVGLNNYMVGSPFSTGVLVADRVALNYTGVGGRMTVCDGGGDVAVGRAMSVAGWSEVGSEHSRDSSQDDKVDGSKDNDSEVSRAISRRDMATQISPESNYSSSKERLSFSPSPVSGDGQKDDTSEFEVRDVQVDKRATVVRRSRRHGKRMTKNKLPTRLSLEGNASEDQALSWEVSAAVDDSKLDREEAKITAWENLQKAKAEAAIRELEVNLEKKRSASVDKILKKLKVAEIKAQKMRSSLSNDQDHHLTTKSRKKFLLGKNIYKGFFGGCFASYAL